MSILQTIQKGSPLIRFGCGPVLMLGAVLSGWFSEYFSKTTATDLGALAPTIQLADPARLDPALEGKLVFLSAPLKANDLEDAEVGLKTPGLRLRREVRLLQWVESVQDITRTDPASGKSRHDHYEYSYSQQWREEAVDSSRFSQRGHDNPPSPRLPAALNLTPLNVRVGPYRIEPELLATLPMTLNWHAPAQRPTQAGVWDAPKGEFFPGLASGAAPQPGAVKLSYQVADLPAEISILGQARGDQLVAFQAPSGSQSPRLRSGHQSLQQFLEGDLQGASLLAWFFRFMDAGALGLGVLCLGLGQNWPWLRRGAILIGLWLLAHALPMVVF